MRRLIAWFAENPVAANALLAVILVGGVLGLMSVRREIFPEYSSDLVVVSVAYPGAAPEEVEEGICVRIEEELQDLDGVRRITSSAGEGGGSVMIEALPGFPARRLLDDVKTRIEAIDTFPEEAEKPVIQEIVFRRQVIYVAVSGETDEATLKRIGEQVRDDLASLPGITTVELASARPYEIAIEISEESLRRHGLTFDAVAAAVRRSSLDLPGGSVKTAGGEVLLRSKSQAYRGREFESIVLLARPDGTRLRLGDVARVVDGFAETDQAARFDGTPAVLVKVFRVGDQSALDISDAVHDYVRTAQARMPPGIRLTPWQDDAEYLRSRLDLLLRNGRSGLILVFCILALFLRLPLAAWVCFGIPLSFLGAFGVMPFFDGSINMLSLFAFILVLGIVVDDATVVGENVYAHLHRTRDGRRAAVAGTQEVSIPVIFGVLTTVAAFAPLLFVGGNMGKFMRIIPQIVIATLLFSLVESQLALPAHLAHLRVEPAAGFGAVGRAWGRFQGGFAAGLDWFIDRLYRPALKRLIRWRYLTVASFVSALALTLGAVGGGWVRFTFFPQVEGNNVVAVLTMPQGTSVETTAAAVRRLEASAFRLREELGRGRETPVVQHILTSIGEQPYRTDQQRGAARAVALITGSNLGEVNLQLIPSEERPGLSSAEIARRWRELTGPVPDAVELTFTGSLFSPGEALNIQLAGREIGPLRAAADALKARLAAYPGVFDVADSFREGKEELTLRLRPAAEALGLTQMDLARQVRQAFYGEEAQRIQRGRDEIKVMVRYPGEARRSIGDLEALRIRLPDGAEVPFSFAASAARGRGYASIQRVDRRRVVNVTADVDAAEGNAEEILRDVEARILPELLAEHPGVTYTLEGQQREQRETIESLQKGFLLALVLIYALLAIPLRAYLQPFLIMTAIPFGLVTAVWGHVVMGMDLSLLSLFGLVALAGVSVNDNLVLVDFINQRRAAGEPLAAAVPRAAASRFRAILLTSLTTIGGLAPLILETSLQARFLVPMAVSLAFGLIGSTAVALLLLPSTYFILEDVLGAVRRVTGFREGPEEGPAAGTEH